MSDASSARHRPRPLRRHLTMTTVALALTALLVSLALIHPLHAQGANSHPGGNIQDPKVLNVDIARPAVVRIYFGFDNPSITVKACAAENISFKLRAYYGLGSGAFISAQGDVLTASHVVKDEGGEFEVGILQYFQDKILADIQKVCGQNLVDINGLLAFLNANPADFTFALGAPVQRLWLDTSYHGPYTETTMSSVKTYTYRVLGVKDYASQKGIGDDVAVIHVDGVTDMPHIAIGDSGAVSPTDHLTEMGYPGNGDDNHIDLASGNYKVVPTDYLTESLNDLYVSAIKTNDEGNPIIQIGGNEEHGDSGGPTLNAAGEIVGVVSFGPDITQSGGLPAGTGFLQASSSAKSLVSGANIDTTPGTFQTKWRQALTDFAATSSGHWHKAVTDLTALQGAYPDFRGGDDYLTYAQNQAANESTLAINLGGNAGYLAYGLGGLAVLVLVIVLIVVAANRSRRRNQAVREAVAVVSTGYGPGQPPPANFPQGGVPPQNFPSAPYGTTPRPRRMAQAPAPHPMVRATRLTARTIPPMARATRPLGQATIHPMATRRHPRRSSRITPTRRRGRRPLRRPTRPAPTGIRCSPMRHIAASVVPAGSKPLLTARPPYLHGREGRAFSLSRPPLVTLERNSARFGRRGSFILAAQRV